MAKKPVVKKPKVTKIVEPTELDEYNILNVIHWISSYRSQNINTTILKQWASEAAEKLDIPDANVITKIDDAWFIDTWGYVGRMFNLGLINKESNLELLITNLKNMVSKTIELKNEDKKRVAPMEIVQDEVESIFEQIEHLQFDPNFDIVKIIQDAGISNLHVKKLQNLLEDEKVVNDIEQYLAASKVKRKPRKLKVKSNDEIAKLFNCMDSFDGIEGHSGADIIGKKCAIVYHTQKKTLTFYIGESLSVARSMIIDFDVEKSGEYKLQQQSHINLKGKAKINGVYNEFYLNAEKATPTGRVTNKMIVVGLF